MAPEAGRAEEAQRVAGGENFIDAAPPTLCYGVTPVEQHGCTADETRP